MVKWPAADEKSEQVVLVDSHMEKKSLQGKEDENEFEQCLLHLFHDNSVQIHKYSQRQLFWELRGVLPNQQRAVSWVFFPFTIAPCNIDSAWHLSVEQPPLQQWGRKRLYQALQERIKKSNWAFSQVLGFISISGKEKVSVWAMERFLRFLLSWYSYYSRVPAVSISTAASWIWDSHMYHVLQETLFITENLQVSLPV